MTDPWSLFNDAIYEPSESRAEQFQEVLATLENNCDIGTSAERAELVAAVQCNLAIEGATSFESAVEAVNEAETRNRYGWPNYYLSQLAMNRGEYGFAIQRLKRIPEGFFEDQELFWRTVHTWEMEAVVDIELDNWISAQQKIERIAAAIATRGDSDDLASPQDLLKALLRHSQNNQVSRKQVRQSLVTLTRSLDVNVWFRPRQVEEINSIVFDKHFAP